MTEPGAPPGEPARQDLPDLYVPRPRRTILGLMAGGLAGVALGWWLLMLGEPGAWAVGVVGIGFFGLTLPLGVVQLVAPPFLLLTPEGLYVRAYVRTRFAPWSAFGGIRLTPAANRYYIQVVCPPLRRPGSARLYKPVALPTFLEIPDEELVDILILYRDTFGDLDHA